MTEPPTTTAAVPDESPDSPFFIAEKPRGKNRFTVMERGAGHRGTARERGTARTRDDAVALTATLEPSTPAEILASIPVYSAGDRERRDRLARLAEPGTRLWIMPTYGERGYQGLGEPATALGLGVNRVEALFGTGDLWCWLVRYRTDSGLEDVTGAALSYEETARLWWVTDGHGNLLTGGHPDRERMRELAAGRGGHVQQGLAQGDAAAGMTASCPADRPAAGPGPGEAWRPLIAAAGAFEPENDGHLLSWMSGEAAGMTGYAEGLAAAYETAVNTIGLDPAALAALHDCAGSAAGAAEQMAVARRRFTTHYAEVRQFAASGGVLPFNGRWMTGAGA